MHDLFVPLQMLARVKNQMQVQLGRIFRILAKEKLLFELVGVVDLEDVEGIAILRNHIVEEVLVRRAVKVFYYFGLREAFALYEIAEAVLLRGLRFRAKEALRVRVDFAGGIATAEGGGNENCFSHKLFKVLGKNISSINFAESPVLIRDVGLPPLKDIIFYDILVGVLFDEVELESELVPGGRRFNSHGLVGADSSLDEFDVYEVFVEFERQRSVLLEGEFYDLGKKGGVHHRGGRRGDESSRPCPYACRLRGIQSSGPWRREGKLCA